MLSKIFLSFLPFQNLLRLPLLLFPPANARDRALQQSQITELGARIAGTDLAGADSDSDSGSTSIERRRHWRVSAAAPHWF